MKIEFWPKSLQGKWAAGFTVLFIVLMALKVSPAIRFFRLPLPTPAIALLGVIGFVLGLIAIFKKKDRALLTLLSIPIGLLILFWSAAELVFPH